MYPAPHFGQILILNVSVFISCLLHRPDLCLGKKFCAEAADAGFVNLKGHRLVGGMRASIYNAMPAEGIDKLVDFMEKFRKENA